MFLTISTTHKPASDLGYLLHKNPARVHAITLSSGKAHVFYSKASAEFCEAALMVTVDPIALVRGKGRGNEGWSLGQYVNDRPYAASSFLSTAIVEAFGTAMNGKCKERPELVEKTLPLTVTIPVLPAGGGEEGIKRLFEPLGYTVVVKRLGLDERFPEWGESSYYSVTLSIKQTVQLVLQHIYVLIPVLDRHKHYYVGKEEVEKLLAKGTEWLPQHPQKEWITQRYLKYQRKLADDALRRLEALDVSPPEADDEEVGASGEEVLEERISLHEQRLGTVTSMLKRLEVNSVADLGCGEGKLLRMLLSQTKIPRILGMDVSSRSLEIAKSRLRYDRMPSAQRGRIELLLGSLMYRDKRLEGVDAMVLVEVIEHLDEPRLKAMERVVFGEAHPRHVIVTTPNAEYNVLFESLPAGRFRHGDHRFEWTRDEFKAWASRVAEQYGYSHEHSLIGPVEEAVGAASQMILFNREETP